MARAARALILLLSGIDPQNPPILLSLENIQERLPGMKRFRRDARRLAITFAARGVVQLP